MFPDLVSAPNSQCGHRIAREPVLVTFLIWGLFLLICGPMLNAGFWLEDDHLIIQLASELKVHPQADPSLDLGGVISRDLTSWGRFRPLYWSVFLVLVKVFGTNALAWHVMRMLVAIATAWFFYFSSRTLGLGIVASVLATFLAILPGASAWIRLGPPEAPGMFFLAVGIWSLTKGVRRPDRVMWDLLLVGAVALSALCKESFILIIPAIGYARFLLWKWHWQRSLSSAFRSSLPTMVAFSVIFIALLCTVWIIAKEAGSYSFGGATLVMPNLSTTLVASLVRPVFHAGAWFFPVILVLAVMFVEHVRGEKSTCAQPLLLISGFFLLWVVPQVVLYASRNGPWYNYALPMCIGTAVVNGLSLVWLWKKSAKWLFALATIWLVAWLGMFIVEDLRLFSFYYRAQARALNRALQSLADNVPYGKALVIVDDPSRSTEPSIALIYLVGYYGRADMPIYLLPAVPQYYHLEFNRRNMESLTSSSYFANRADATVIAPANVGAVIFLVPPDRLSGRQKSWLDTMSWDRIEFAESWLKIFADPYGNPFRLGFWRSKVDYPVWVRKQ